MRGDGVTPWHDDGMRRGGGGGGGGGGCSTSLSATPVEIVEPLARKRNQRSGSTL
jgi:hypothetical protein